MRPFFPSALLSSTAPIATSTAALVLASGLALQASACGAEVSQNPPGSNDDAGQPIVVTPVTTVDDDAGVPLVAIDAAIIEDAGPDVVHPVGYCPSACVSLPSGVPPCNDPSWPCDCQNGVAPTGCAPAPNGRGVLFCCQ